MSTSANPSHAPENSPKKTYRLMALMAVAAILLIGIAIYSLSQIGTGEGASSLNDLVLNPSAPQSVPAFQFSDQGKTLAPESFKGHWTLLTFWANWCGPCLEEMPALNTLGQQWQGARFEILTINTDDPKSENYEAAHNFLSEHEIVLPTMFDPAGVLKKAFGVEELPRHFLINPDAKIVWQEKGAFKWNEAKARDQLMRAMGDEAFPEDTLGENANGANEAGAEDADSPSTAPTPSTNGTQGSAK